MCIHSKCITVVFQPKTQLKNWSSFDVEGVCSFLASLKGVTPAVLPAYTKHVRDNNVSGLVLQNCDLDELRPVLQMRFGDWQLFKAAILSLREWDGCLVSPDSDDSTQTANNSATPPVSSVASPRDKDAAPAASREGISKFQQGRGIPSKGQRMRRNDSIVQQLSFEAAILHEALEEFSEDSDKDGVDADDFSQQVASGSASVSDEGASRPASEAQPPTPNTYGTDSATMKKLSSLITVLDAPCDAVDDEGASLSESSDPQFSPFVMQSSFPSGAQLPDDFGGEEATGHDRNESHLDSQGHRHPFLQSLSTSLEKITRPIIHAFGHSGDQHLHYLAGEEREVSSDRIALMMMPSRDPTATAAVLPVENPQASEATSPWDHSIFTSVAQSSTPASQTVAIVEMPPDARPTFSLGSEHSSPSHPTLTMESETSESICTDSSGVRSRNLSGEALQLGLGGGHDKDSESFV